VLPTLPADSVQLVVTSPPYNVGWCYGDDGSVQTNQVGRPPLATPEEVPHA